MSNQPNKMRGEADFNSDEVLPWPFHTLTLFKFYKAISLQQQLRNIMHKKLSRVQKETRCIVGASTFRKPIAERHLLHRDEKTGLWALKSEDMN